MATKKKVTTKEPMKTEKRGVVEKVTLHTRVFTDNSLTKGGEVKEARGVLKVLHREFKGRTATINCKVEAFGRILHRFDNRRKQWVCELGFGGLYHLCGKNLPRNFVYWLMTRVDPVNQLFRGTNGVDVPMNKNQVRWILGLPKGEKVIPTNEGDADEQMKIAAQNVLRLYGRKWQSVNPRKRSDMIYTDAIPVNPKFLERLEGEWGENDEQEFKTMFLIAALAMVLCPTQCGRLSAGTIYACTLGMQSSQYDWCKLVYDFFIERAKVFCRDFYTYGWTKGVGGCTMYLVCVVVVYGETQHPRATKDSHGPVEKVYIPVMDNEILTLKPRKKGNSERNPMKMRQMAEREKENSIELERIELHMETVNEEPIITPPPPRTQSRSERCQQVTSSPPPKVPPPPPKVSPPPPKVPPPPPSTKVTSPLPSPSPPKDTSPLPSPSPPKDTSPLPSPSPPKDTSPLPSPSPPKDTSPLNPQLCVTLC
ncbi:uncharacterized protein [Spinacia oleracea]|uniref:Aminotransferase-like plant mobile domain-containing protein n=1 Tax=Spinacia oleracea TaxID=3562 RepID=A0ABM3RIQ8_SPIOL|nr:uncharacterized protein LOC110781076 [Spinacia oleracea]